MKVDISKPFYYCDPIAIGDWKASAGVVIKKATRLHHITPEVYESNIFQELFFEN